jgi:UDP:flavonoid glycosyltransferase YjiC (YdhE family)
MRLEALRMRIVIPTIGTRGDVQPYLALAAGLQAAGHDVTVMTHPALRTLVTGYAVPFAPMGPDVDLGQEAARIRGRSGNWLLGFWRVMQFSFAMLEQSHADILAECRDADLVVVSHSGAGRMEADQLGLPMVSVTLMPQAIPRPDPKASLGKRVVMGVAGAGMGWMMTRPVNRIRARAGLPPMGPEGITSRLLNLIPISPRVIAPDPLWEARHQVTGYWFAEPPANWQPPRDLADFLAAGDPPVVVSLGAMAISGRDTLEAARVTLAALEQVGVRAVVQGWGEALDTLGTPTNVKRAGSVPHHWLLPRAAGIVHHGGFGTTASGLQAGIPAVVVPHIIDQFIWGQRLHELGVSVAPIPRTKLTVAKLAEALERVCGDVTLRDRAAELGTQIRAERGVAQAVWLIAASLARAHEPVKAGEGPDWDYGGFQDV